MKKNNNLQFRIRKITPQMIIAGLIAAIVIIAVAFIWHVTHPNPDVLMADIEAKMVRDPIFGMEVLRFISGR